MPIYHYKCKTCGNEFQYEQKITDEALKVCPVEICNQTKKGMGKVYRLISKNVGVIFNGRGFYQTDYATKNKNGNTSKSSSMPITNTCGSNDCACKTESGSTDKKAS